MSRNVFLRRAVKMPKRSGCDCKALFDEIPEDERKGNPPTYNKETGRIEQLFVIEKDHIWRDSWEVMEARDLIVEMHGPDSALIPPGQTGPKHVLCIHCNTMHQKHRFNLHRNHAKCKGEGMVGVKMPSYPSLVGNHVGTFVASLLECVTVEEVISAFGTLGHAAPKRKARKSGDKEEDSINRAPLQRAKRVVGRPQKRTASASRKRPPPVIVESSDDTSSAESGADQSTDQEADNAGAVVIAAKGDVMRSGDDASRNSVAEISEWRVQKSVVAPTKKVPRAEEATKKEATKKVARAEEATKKVARAEGVAVPKKKVARAEEATKKTTKASRPSEMPKRPRVIPPEETVVASTPIIPPAQLRLKEMSTAERPSDSDSGPRDSLPTSPMQPITLATIMGARSSAGASPDWHLALSGTEGRGRDLELARADKIRRLQEDAEGLFPLQLPISPERDLPKPALYLLLQHGLLDREAMGGLASEDELLKTIFGMVGSTLNQARFYQALGACISEGVGIAENAVLLPRLTTLCNRAKNPVDGASEELWSDAVSQTWAYMTYEKECVEYESRRTAVLERTKQSRETYVANELEKFDAEMAVEREAVRWDFNSLFGFCAMNRILRAFLPPLPWTHNVDEAKEVVQRLAGTRIDRVPAPAGARLLKCYFVCNGLSRM